MIAAAAAPVLIGQGIDALVQSGQNKKARKFAEKMYSKQRADALADWNMQNEYNSPQAQMQRLKAAGLNPNLVYGNGAEGNAPAPVRSSEAPKWNPKAVDGFSRAATGAIDSAARVAQIDNTRAQNDNLHEQNEVLKAEKALKDAQAYGVLVNASRGEFDLELDSELRDVSADMRRAQLDQVRANVRFTLNNDERAAALNASNLREATERILNMRFDRQSFKPAQIRDINARIANLGIDNQLKKLDLELWKQGISRTDPAWMRILSRVAGKLMDELKPAYDKMQKAGGAVRLGSSFLNPFKLLPDSADKAVMRSFLNP